MINQIKKACREIHLLTLIFCCGSLFPLFIPYSEMSGMIQRKWAALGVLVLLLLCIKSLCLRKPFANHADSVSKTFLVFGVVEIVIVILQLFRILPSYNLYYRFTGSFDNPAIFAMLMSTCLPICLFYTIKSTEKNNKVWYFLTLCVALCLLLAESRTCIIAGVCSSFVIVFFERPQFRSYLSNRKVWIPALGGCLIMLIALYLYKRDSADGRTLLWAVSLKMISEKPLLGWGSDGFSASYMQNQAAFLLHHPESKLVYLADNVTHPFNEFLLFGIKYGFVGLSVLSFVIVFLFWMFLRIKDAHKSLYLSILLTLFILSMFSYPFMVPMVWLISVYVVCSIVCIYCTKHSGIRTPIMILLFSGVLWTVFLNRRIYDEWLWHKLQISTVPTETIRSNYAHLYPSLKTNPSFIYNYGAWLHHNGYYEESLDILNDCTNSFDDYNLELLLADDYRQLGDIEKSIEKFEIANAMIPSKFLPLYHEMITYEDVGDYDNACLIAGKIVNKPIKIKKSSSVRKIIYKARDIISSHTKKKQL